MKIGPYELDTNLRYGVLFRHGPRARRPELGNCWDYDCPLDLKAELIAQKTIELYFGDAEPSMLVPSPIPRSRATLELLWPHLSAQISPDDHRLGPTREEVKDWRLIDAMPQPYDATLVDMHTTDPVLIEWCGLNGMMAIRDIASAVQPGTFGVACSHTPIADRVAYVALGKWLPQPFESGGALLLGFDDLRVKSCDYLPVPKL